MVNIIQTVNYLESYEHVDKICKLILETELNGIRVNLCKYRTEDIQRIIQNYISVFAYRGIKNIYLDIPYPIDKARIYGIGLNKKSIKKNEEYFIIRSNTNDTIPVCRNNEIYVKCNEFNITRDVIFYGDGEGAFKVCEVNGKVIRCIAINDFFVINGKSISCGFCNQNSEIIINILKSIGDMKVGLLIPFVEDANKIQLIRDMASKNISLISKIETNYGIQNIKEIANSSDAIVIGRGDLALYSDLQELIPKLWRALKSVRKKKIIFCTGILKNFSNNYFPERAELFDLLLLRQLFVDEIILSGSSNFNANSIDNSYLHTLCDIKRKLEFIKSVW